MTAITSLAFAGPVLAAVVGRGRSSPAFPPCAGDGLSFPPSALEGPADPGPAPAAEALRANRRGFPLSSGSQWRMLGKSEAQVLFAAGDPRKGAEGGGFEYAMVERQGQAWEIGGSGGCVPRPVRKGLGQADWEPEGPAEGTRFVAMVVERACASGASSEDRIYPPDIEYRADSVVVTFWVRPRPGGQTCQSNPPTRYEVKLKEGIATASS